MADSIDSRRFSDDEVREILEKAVQRSSSRALSSAEGMSLAELKSVGAEAGIDPARIEEAARGMVTAPKAERVGFLGGPLHRHAERVVEGEIGEADMADLIAVIRRGMGKQGQVTEVGGALEWSAKGDSGARYVSVSSRDGKTTIRAASDLSLPATATYLPTGIIGVIMSAAAFIGSADAGNEVGMVLALLILPLIYLAARTFLGRLSQKDAQRLDSVVDELARTVAEVPGD